MVDVRIDGIVGERGPDAPIEHLGDIIDDRFDAHNPAAAERDGAASD